MSHRFAQLTSCQVARSERLGYKEVGESGPGHLETTGRLSSAVVSLFTALLTAFTAPGGMSSEASLSRKKGPTPAAMKPTLLSSDFVAAAATTDAAASTVFPRPVAVLFR